MYKLIKKTIKINNIFFKEIEKGVRSLRNRIRLDLWGFIPCVCLSVGPFSTSNSNWAHSNGYLFTIHRMFESFIGTLYSRKKVIEALRATLQ